jgi:hypothetical protein
MIQLASRVWNLDIHATIALLVDKLPELTLYRIDKEAIDKYERYYIEEQQNAKDFWKLASDRIINGIGLRQLQLDMGIASDLTENEWQKRGGQFIGSADRHEIDQLLVRHSAKSSIFYRQDKISIRNWRTMVVIPFWDMPKHLAGFMIYREEQGKAVPFKYYTVQPQFRGIKPIIPGVAMLDALYTSDGPGTDTAAVFLDPLLAARTHIKQLANSNEILPLVAVWPENPVCAILREHLPGRDLVFFDHTLNANLFRHASAVNGRVIQRSVKESVAAYSRRVPVRVWFDRLIKTARPWDQVLEEHLYTLTSTQIEALLSQLQWPLHQLREFITGCPSDLRSRLEKLLARQYRGRCVEVSGHIIVETEKGWHCAKSNEVITDAPFRIEHVVYNKYTGNIHYQGYVTYEGECIPFVAPADDFDRAPMTWLDRYLISLGKGPTYFVNYYWQKLATAIAKRFHRPTTIQGFKNYGWDEANARFVLPKYWIEQGGEVVEHKLPVPDTKVLPAQNLSKPVELALDEIELLQTGTDDVMRLWQLSAVVLHNILAPIYNYQPKGTLIVGSVPSTVELANSLGCPEWRPGKYLYEVEPFRAIEQQASWPVVIYGNVPRNVYVYKYLEQQPHNIIIEANWYLSRLLAIRGGWFRLDSEYQFPTSRDVTCLASKIIPSFLKHLMANKLKRTGVHQTTLQRVVADLANWFRISGGDEKCVFEACQGIYEDFDKSAADAFFELLGQLYDNGLVTLYQGKTKPSIMPAQPMMVELEDYGGSIWIPKAGINEALGKRVAYLSVLDVGAVSQALTESEELLEECSLQDVPGWLIKKSTWQLRTKANQMVRRNKKRNA